MGERGQAFADLHGMISTMRPHNSLHEDRFISRWLVPLKLKVDSFGNLYKWVGEDSPMVWSCHTDTVHKSGGTQILAMTDKEVLKLHKKSESNCLGADDTAGVWLMRELIMAKKPGLYLFHRGEEVGGLGSKFIALRNAKALGGTKFVVALDRMDNNSVITFQRGQRCCSDEFGNSLAEGLNLGYKLDKGGSFTDSANYTDIVGECTNLSVGYKHQHCKGEELDVAHLFNLRAALLQLNVDNLVSKRKPGDKESRYSTYTYSSHYNGGNWSKNRNDSYIKDYKGGCWEGNTWRSLSKVEWEKWKEEQTAYPDSTVTSSVTTPSNNVSHLPQDGAMLKFIREHPVALAKMLEDWGFDEEMLRWQVAEYMFKRADDVSTVQ